MKLCKYEQLRYICPGNGGWGMVRIAMMIPESYELFISPAPVGVMAHWVRCSTGSRTGCPTILWMKKDIIEGYDAAVMDAAGKLLACLETRGKKPRVLILFVTCIDDLIGTDNDAVAWGAGTVDIRHVFIFCHMNPITDDRRILRWYRSIRAFISSLGDSGMTQR